MKYIKKFLLLTLIFLGLTMEGMALDNKYAVLIIEVPDTEHGSILIQSWQNGYKSNEIMQVSQNGDSRTYHIPFNCLPCQLTIEFIQKDKNKKPKSLDVFMEQKDLFLQITSWDGRPNWHGDVQNSANEIFMQRILTEKQQINLLQNFLSNYIETDELAEHVADTYTQKCKVYNEWTKKQISENKELWFSKLWKAQLVTGATISADKGRNIQEIIAHTFDFEEFIDTTLLKTNYYLNLLNNYMSLNELQIQQSGVNRNIAMTQAGEILAQKASQGHPRLYGWVVDYLYTNYERYAINEGIAMLGDHLQDPNCWTSQKLEIQRRLDGMQRLKPGKTAPKLQLVDTAGKLLNITNNGKKLALLFFYDSECGHCLDELSKLEKWYSSEKSNKITVLTIALDDNMENWKSFHKAQDFKWLDLYAPGGINGVVAEDFALLSTPSLLVIGKNNKIVNVPTGINELLAFLQSVNK